MWVGMWEGECGWVCGCVWVCVEGVCLGRWGREEWKCICVGICAGRPPVHVYFSIFIYLFILL